MPSLCGSAEATRARFRAFADYSVLTCRPLRPRGARTPQFQIAMPTSSSPQANRLDTPKTPTIRITWGSNFVASLVHSCYGLPDCSPPLVGSDRDCSPPPEAFTSRLPAGSVALTAAGYDYDIDWTPMSAGLAPAGTAASFAAPGWVEPLRETQRTARASVGSRKRSTHPTEATYSFACKSRTKADRPV